MNLQICLSCYIQEIWLRCITVLPQPICFSVLAPPNYYLFLWMKALLKGWRFPPEEAWGYDGSTKGSCIKGLQECFQYWYGCWQKCVTTVTTSKAVCSKTCHNATKFPSSQNSFIISRIKQLLLEQLLIRFNETEIYMENFVTAIISLIQHNTLWTYEGASRSFWTES